MLQRALLISVLVLMSACGFHLKGDVLLSENLQQVKLQLSQDKEFNQYLEQQLKKAGAQITEQNDVAFMGVSLKQNDEAIVAKSSSSGLEVIRLSLELEYSLRSATGEWLAEQKTISQTREFDSDSSQLLAKSSEKQKLYQQMKLNLSRLLLYQIQINDR